MLPTKLTTSIVGVCLMLGACGTTNAVIVDRMDASGVESTTTVELPTAADCWADISACSLDDTDTARIPSTSQPVVTVVASTTTTLVDPFSVMTVEEVLASASDEEIAEVGGPACAVELIEITLGYVRYRDETGEEPSSMIDVLDQGFIESPILLWTLDATSAVPSPDGPCIGPVALIADRSDICRVEFLTLSVAVEAYRAQFGADTVPTEADLVGGGLLRDEVTYLDLVDGEVVAVDGLLCDSVSFEDREPEMALSEDECDIERRTLEVGIEAYYAMFGADMHPTESDLVTFGLLRSEFADYDIVLNGSGTEVDILVVDGSICS